MSYKHEKMRPTFKLEFKKIWEQGESLILLVLLYHSGLIQIGFKMNEKYILEQIKVLDDTRGKILSKMLVMLQAEREWQHTISQILDKTREVRARRLEEQIESRLLAQKGPDVQLSTSEKDKDKELSRQHPPLIKRSSFKKSGKKLIHVPDRPRPLPASSYPRIEEEHKFN